MCPQKRLLPLEPDRRPCSVFCLIMTTTAGLMTSLKCSPALTVSSGVSDSDTGRFSIDPSLIFLPLMLITALLSLKLSQIFFTDRLTPCSYM